MKRQLVNLMGFGIDTFDFDNAIKYAVELMENRIGGQIVTINPEMIENARKNKDFAKVINDAQLVIPDGIGVKIGLKMKGYKNIERIAGVEFAYYLIKECETNNFSVAMVGARPHVISEAAKNIQAKMPRLKIVYTHNGFFSDDERVLQEIKQKNPRLILVALGSPKQEHFINRLKELLPNAVMIGVGGSFDVWSGYVQRAPEIYQKLGLEWLYRTVKEPKRFKRIFPTLPNFLLHVLISKK